MYHRSYNKTITRTAPSRKYKWEKWFPFPDNGLSHLAKRSESEDVLGTSSSPSPGARRGHDSLRDSLQSEGVVFPAFTHRTEVKQELFCRRSNLVVLTALTTRKSTETEALERAFGAKRWEER